MVDARVVGAVLVSLLAVATGAQSNAIGSLPKNFSEIDSESIRQLLDKFDRREEEDLPEPNSSINASFKLNSNPEFRVTGGSVRFGGKEEVGLVNGKVRSDLNLVFEGFDGEVYGNGTVLGTAESVSTDSSVFDTQVRISDSGEDRSVNFTDVEPLSMKFESSESRIELGQGITNIRSSTSIRISSFEGNFTLNRSELILTGEVSSIEAGSFSFSQN